MSRAEPSEAPAAASKGEPSAEKKPRDLLVGHANTWHDGAIALSEGELFFAEAVERHTQCKRAVDMSGLWYSSRAIRNYLASEGGWPVDGAQVVALSSWSGEQPLRILEHPGRNPIPALLVRSVALEPLFVNQLRWTLAGHPPKPFALAEEAPGAPSSKPVSLSAKTVLHQLAHAANAVYSSPFSEAVVMVIDGYSEGTALSFYHFDQNRFRLIHQERPQVSLGLLYALVTQFCGFDPYEGEEWKLMGLAAYGEPREDLYAFFKERLRVDGLSLSFKPPSGATYAFDRSAWAELARLAGGFRQPGDGDILRAADLAHNFQRSFEETLVELARNLGRLGLSKHLAFAGGCALNSAANGRLVTETDFEKLHVPSAPADDGNALGVVLYEKYHERGEDRPLQEMSPYLGSRVDLEELTRILGFGGIPFEKAADDEELCEQVSGHLAAGRIVGWVQGRAEFGPRALGNRSILADPRPPEMKDIINSRVKFREFYRPLAPAILDEHGSEYFLDYQASPYMERTLRFRPEVQNRVPAVVHRDGTGRLQTVREAWNPLFHRLLSSFHRRTGVPVLLNTSFNVMGKPMVHSIQDAITVFFTTGLDLLVVGPYILFKRP
jgi:carbamoyltransferase